MNLPPAEIEFLSTTSTPWRSSSTSTRSIATLRKWPSLRVRLGYVCVRTPRLTNRLPSRCGRSRRAPSVNASKRSARREALVRGGVTDVLVAMRSSAIVLRRLAALARDATIALCFDSPEQVEQPRGGGDFDVELGGLVEIEVGMERCGVAPGKRCGRTRPPYRRRAEFKFRGLQAYHGRAQHMATYQQRAQAIASAVDPVRETLDALKADGLTCEIVGGAGTGTFAFEAESGVGNELQVGSYVFMDTEYARIGNKDGGLYTAFEHSLFVLATVISVPADDRAIVDAG